MFDIHTHTLGSPDSVVNLSYKNFTEPLPKYFSFGIHPWNVREESMDMDLEGLRTAIEMHRPTFLGECGIDKVCNVPIKIQTETFRKQVKLAIDFSLPLIIHCVRASSEIVSVLKSANFNNTVVFHGIRSGIKPILSLLEYSENKKAFFSFGEKNQAETLRKIPSDKLLIESDEGNIENAYISVERVLGKDILKTVEENWHRALSIEQ